jgi:hypothetical protein
MDFLTLLKRFHDSRVEFVIVGGYASMILGCDLLTQDLDLCVRLGAGNLNRIYDAIEDLHPRYRMAPGRPLLTRETATSESIKNLYLQTDLGQIDCLGSILGLGDFDAVLQHSREIEMDFGPVRLLDFDGLIRAKEALGREKDLPAIQRLRAIREKLDRQ